jgi:hypothetical protein
MKKHKTPLLISLLLLISVALSGCAADSAPEKANNQKKPAAPKTTVEKTDEPKRALSYDNVFKQMFPDAKFSPKDANSVATATGETYFIEQVTYGQFVGKGPEFLVVVRRPREELAHAQGFYNAWLGVFDAQKQKLLSPVKNFAADEGSINLFKGRTRTHIFFAGSTTFQGFTGWSGGLFKATGDRWVETWPKDPKFWEGRAIEVGQDRLILYKVEVLPGEEVGTIPEYKLTIEEQLLWDPEKETFVSIKK